MSNRRALFLGVRVKVRADNKKVRFRLPPMALYVFRGAIISFDAVTGLIPGKAGQYVRSAQKALDALIDGIMRVGPCEYANVQVESEKESVRVRVHSY